MPSLISVIVGLIVTVGFIILFASGSYKHVRLWRAIASVLLAIPAAALTYMILGIKIAHHYGEPRFYSWPIGGGAYKTNDTVIVLSLVFWLIVWSAILFTTSNLLPVEKHTSPTTAVPAKEPKRLRADD
jgi:hypothetical protein